MKKVDFKKELKHLYKPPTNRVEIVNVPEMNFLMIDGKGDPNTSQEFSDAVEALFGVSYTLKFMIKNGEREIDYGVTPLEGLWWAEDMEAFTTTRDKSQWDWTMMIMTPEWISSEIYAEALALVRKGKNPTALDKVRLERYDEGLCVQIMYVGSYDDEGPLLMKLHQEFLPENGYAENGKHHEIYLGDPRRVAPEKLKTVLRQPVREL